MKDKLLNLAQLLRSQGEMAKQAKTKKLANVIAAAKGLQHLKNQLGR